MFKYRAINKYSIDSLVKGSIYFAAPDKLNDPFDCKVDVRKSVSNAERYSCACKSKKLMDLLNNQAFFDKFKLKISEVGICSFSLELKSVLMWSHYADEHKGMAILYEFPEVFLNEGKFIGTVKVRYKENSLTNWFIKKANQLPMNSDDLGVELAKKYFASKSPDWGYEKEVRIIRPKQGPFIIKKDFIKQICFGLNTPDEDIDLIKAIVAHYKHKVDLCRMVRTDSDFGLDVKKI